jgi:hypothetical protein
MRSLAAKTDRAQKEETRVTRSKYLNEGHPVEATVLG